MSATNVAIEFILADANSLQCFKTLLVKAFMDDLFLEAKNVDELQILVVYWMGKDVFKGIQIKNFGSS